MVFKYRNRCIVTAFFLGFLLIHASLFSKEVELEQARRVAQTQMAAISSIDRAETVTAEWVFTKNFTDDSGNLKAAYYVFGSDEGFVIIAGDDKVVPVLGYSSNGSFDRQTAPKGLIKLMFNYAAEIRRIATDNDIRSTSEIMTRWDELENGIVPQNRANSVSPLTTTEWNQSPYYNMYCPDDSPSGCVAAATSQIMKYHQHPAQGIGNHSYYHSSYGTLSANFGATTYDWANMPNSLNSGSPQTQKEEIAQLMYHVGIALDMNYSPSSSGAFSNEVPDVLINYFGYNSSADYIKRNQHSLSWWINAIKDELDNARVVYHSGFCPDPEAGHAFVLDGYDQNDNFHINWGWGGYANGYFQVNNLNPGSTYTFNQTQGAIIGIIPAQSTSDLTLFDNMNLNPSNMEAGQPFTVTTDIANWGNSAFSGSVKAALFDMNDVFVADIDQQALSIASFDYATVVLNTSALDVPPGDYSLGIYMKETGSNDWTLVGPDTYTNPLNITVNGTDPTGLIPNGNIVVTPEPVSVDEPFQIEFTVLNNSASSFNGLISMDLHESNGNWITELDNESVSIAANGSQVIVFNHSGISVDPGSYTFVIWHQPNGGSWDEVEDGIYPASINVDVIGLDYSAYEPDVYEDNDSEFNAHELSLSWNQNSTDFYITGANMHDFGDKDHFSITLGAGYDYTIYTRMHDSYNNTTGGSYSNDVIFKFHDGTVWSDFYDDVEMPTAAVTALGQPVEVMFMVSSFFDEYFGTYDVQVQITRSSNGVVGVAESESNRVSIYPNPASDHFVIEQPDGDLTAIEIYSMTGKLVRTMQTDAQETVWRIAVDGLSTGTYLVRMIGSESVVTQMLRIGK